MINTASNEKNHMIEMHHNFEEKLNIAKLVLKTLGIQYQVKTPNTHTSYLKNALMRKTLSQVQDELIKL